MRRAIELARENPKAPFAALVVDRSTGKVVAEGLNRAGDNPLRHGEVEALLACDAEMLRRGRDGFVLVTTAEPCPMCQAAILWAGVREVVYGTSIPTLIGLGLPQFVLRADEVAGRANFAACALVGGVLEAECDELFKAAARRDV